MLLVKTDRDGDDKGSVDKFGGDSSDVASVGGSRLHLLGVKY